MARLVAVKGYDTGKEWNLAGSEISIGRHNANAVILIDPKVSRRHLTIQEVGGETVLTNLSTSHGTYVNGIRVEESLQLDDNDQIKIGDTVLVFHKDAPSPKAAAARAAGIIRDTSSREIEIGLDDAGDPQSFDLVLDPVNDSMPSMAVAPQDATKLKQIYERMVLIQEIGKQLVTQLDLRVLFSLILDKVFDLMRVDTGSVLLFNPELGRVFPVAVRDRRGQASFETLNVSRGMVQFAVKHRAGVLSSDTQRDERFQEQMSVIARGIRSAMCVPLVYGDEVLGVIYIDNVITDHAFTQDDLNLLTVLANQAAVAVRNAKLCEQIVAEETQRANLSRYLTPQLVEQIANNEFQLGLGGEQVKAAILFSDIRGFTAMSESMTPHAVVSMLNAYFSEMTEIVFNYQGTLDKYVGDAVIAAFGSPVPDPEACLNALRCAAGMQKRLKEMTLDGPAIGIGIGLHYGDVIHGNVGSERIMQYTVIGDTVNTASRFCSQAPAGKIRMSRQFVENIGREVPMIELEPVKLKGKAEPMQIYEFAGELEDLQIYAGKSGGAA